MSSAAFEGPAEVVGDLDGAGESSLKALSWAPVSELPPLLLAAVEDFVTDEADVFPFTGACFAGVLLVLVVFGGAEAPEVEATENRSSSDGLFDLLADCLVLQLLLPSHFFSVRGMSAASASCST
jgi:hypothetical protein